jgi:hypothetical protein
LVGIEARGFIFGPAIALAIGAKFIPLRKPKKLPGDVAGDVNTNKTLTPKMNMTSYAIYSRPYHDIYSKHIGKNNYDIWICHFLVHRETQRYQYMHATW